MIFNDLLKDLQQPWGWTETMKLSSSVVALQMYMNRVDLKMTDEEMKTLFWDCHKAARIAMELMNKLEENK